MADDIDKITAKIKYGTCGKAADKLPNTDDTVGPVIAIIGCSIVTLFLCTVAVLLLFGLYRLVTLGM